MTWRGFTGTVMVLLGLGALAAASPEIEPTTFAAIAQARQSFIVEVGARVPGATVAVAVNGRIVWSEGFGLADLAAKVPATPATRFRVGSVAKPLTAAGLMLLVERGRLDLDQPVQKYVPDFPRQRGILTLRLLAGHLSGIRNYHGREILSNERFPDLRAGLKRFEDDPLESAPGARYSYSSYNWNLIGVAMERAAKQDFLGFMADNVFRPLGLKHTAPDRSGVTDAPRARFYEEDAAGDFVEAPPVDSSYKWPSGGFLSTADDLARFGSALLEPGFLKAESLATLFTAQKTTDGERTRYGVGWFVGQATVFHGGDSVGGTAALLILPSAKVVVAIACNRGHFMVRDRLGEPTLKSAGDRFSSGVLVKEAHRIADLFAAAARAPVDGRVSSPSKAPPTIQPPVGKPS